LTSATASGDLIDLQTIQHEAVKSPLTASRLLHKNRLDQNAAAILVINRRNFRAMTHGSRDTRKIPAPSATALRTHHARIIVNPRAALAKPI